MKFAWDYSNFYLYVNITDDVEHSWNGTIGNPWEFDCIELHFQLDTQTVPSAYTDNTVQLRLSRGDAGFISSTMRSGLDAADILYYWENTADGWLAECAIPWVFMLPNGALPEDIMDYLPLIGFDMMISDSDGFDPNVGERNSGTQIAWDADGVPDDTADGTEDNAWNNTSVFGYLNLVGSPVPPPPPNYPPVANAGPNQTVNENTEVNLDGTATYDPEGGSITYHWIAPTGIVLSDISSASSTITTPEVGSNTSISIGLQVFDEYSQSGYDNVIIYVKNINQPPVADAGPNRIVNEHELLLIQGSAIDPDPFDLLYFSWNSLQNLPFIEDISGNPMLVAPDVVLTDTFQFVLTANDGYFNSEPDTMNLIVNPVICERDTIFIYETLYVETPYYNTILISVVDDDGKLVVTEKNGELIVELYPNPADQFINIRSEETILEVEIWDINSNEVLSEKVDAFSAELNLGGFSAGNYFLRIHTDTGLVIKQLVLK
jgi:hypothetical protein